MEGKRLVISLLGLRSTNEMRHFEGNDHREFNDSTISVVLVEPWDLVDKFLDFRTIRESLLDGISVGAMTCKKSTNLLNSMGRVAIKEAVANDFLTVLEESLFEGEKKNKKKKRRKKENKPFWRSHSYKE